MCDEWEKKYKEIDSCIKIKNEVKEKEQESCDDADNDDADDRMTKKLIRA